MAEASDTTTVQIDAVEVTLPTGVVTFTDLPRDDVHAFADLATGVHVAVYRHPAPVSPDLKLGGAVGAAVDAITGGEEHHVVRSVREKRTEIAEMTLGPDSARGAIVVVADTGDAVVTVVRVSYPAVDSCAEIARGIAASVRVVDVAAADGPRRTA